MPKSEECQLGYALLEARAFWSLGGISPVAAGSGLDGNMGF